MKVRVIYNADKTVSVIHPAPKSRRDNETEAAWLNRVFSKATPASVEHDDIEKSELPQTREDRTAWEGEKGKGVSVNIEKVQAIKTMKANKLSIINKINSDIRTNAIIALKAEGKLPEDYTE